MERGQLSLVGRLFLLPGLFANIEAEHTLLVTADGVEILTARLPDSPGGPVPMPVAAVAAVEANGEKNGVNGDAAQ
jgi:hypothetical protein